ncbi:MAG: Tad domain-containing protein, partial [bacterium]
MKINNNTRRYSWSLPGLLGDERGNVGVVVAMFLAVIFGFAGLVIDVGHLFVVRSNLQNV